MKIIINLTEEKDLLNKGYELHTDKWYSSSALFQYLQAQKTSVVSTVHTNIKGMLSDLQQLRRRHIILRVHWLECSSLSGWTSVWWQCFPSTTPARSPPCLSTTEGLRGQSPKLWFPTTMTCKALTYRISWCCCTYQPEKPSGTRIFFFICWIWQS